MEMVTIIITAKNDSNLHEVVHSEIALQSNHFIDLTKLERDFIQNCSVITITHVYLTDGEFIDCLRSCSLACECVQHAGPV